MLCLSMETSTKTCAVALVDKNKTLGEIIINSEYTHSQKLLPAVDILLKSVNRSIEDISLIGVATGPGSFTGLRIGLSTAKALAYGKKIPIIGVPTLEGLAKGSGVIGNYVVPILNARRNQVYTGIYKYSSGNYHTELPQRVIKLEELINEIKGIDGGFVFTGDGVPIFSQQIKEMLGEKAYFISPYNCIPRAVSIAEIAISKYIEQGADNPFTLKPEYLRLSEAERNLLKGCN